jgi:trans-AT polyketide synthase/acyltransferase/oxidoreductase domain-containing protein
MIKKPIIFMFSGQGSHYYQMGKALQHPVFRHWLDQADRLAYQELGQSLLAIMYANDKKKSDVFKQTLYTHPALFMVQYALAQTLIAEGIYPAKVLGASLGELVAAAVAGIISWETGLYMAIRQAQLLEHYCLPGGMLAILQDKRLYDEQLLLHQNLSLAADNFPGHFIVAGEQALVAQASVWLKEQSISIHPLAVSQGFHSSLIEPAQAAIIDYQASLVYQVAKMPYVSCMTASELGQVNAAHFWQAIRAPILFRQTLATLEQAAAYCYVDIGPSGTLATFVKYNLASTSQSVAITSLSPYAPEQDMLLRLKQSLVPYL